MAQPSEVDAFVRAICERPTDDAPRLIFADWLDEHGESDRAKFIRDQIRIQESPHRYFIKYVGRLDQLADLHVWNRQLDRVTTPSVIEVFNSGCSSVVFRRGFPQTIHGTFNVLVPYITIGSCHRHGGLFAKHPIQAISIADSPPFPRQLDRLALRLKRLRQTIPPTITLDHYKDVVSDAFVKRARLLVGFDDPD